jgi:hypothetical protein
MLREQGRSSGEQEAAARSQREEQLRHLKLERCQTRAGATGSSPPEDPGN